MVFWSRMGQGLVQVNPLFLQCRLVSYPHVREEERMQGVLGRTASEGDQGCG